MLERLSSFRKAAFPAIAVVLIYLVTSGVSRQSSLRAAGGWSHTADFLNDVSVIRNRCFLLGRPSDGSVEVRLNSRFLCTLSPVCFPAQNLTEALVLIVADDVGRRRNGYDSRTANGNNNDFRTSFAPEDFAPKCFSVPVDAANRASLDSEELPAKLCAQLRHEGLACAHGFGSADAIGHPMNNCTAWKTMTSTDLLALDQAGKILWYNDLSIIVPQYSWVSNIYHHARQLLFVAHIIQHVHQYIDHGLWSILDRHYGSIRKGWRQEYSRANEERSRLRSRRRLRVVYRLRGYYAKPWHMQVSEMFFRNLFPSIASGFAVDSSPNYLFPKPDHTLICFRAALLMGNEGATDSLLFLNDSALPSSPPSIPRAALTFRELAYASMNLSSVVLRDLALRTVVQSPRKGARFAGISHHDRETVSYIRRATGRSLTHRASVLDQNPPPSLQLALPSRTVAYVVRETSSLRQLSDSDERWIVRMLESEARSRKFVFRRISFSSEQSPKTQVEMVHNIGFLVGVHGANLANSIFMRPGSALFEIFPTDYVQYFYLNGGNSGLRYSSHEVFSANSHNCSSIELGLLSHILRRNVIISLRSVDRSAIADHVLHGMDYVEALHAAFPSGMLPVRFNETKRVYEIQDFRFKPSPLAVDRCRYDYFTDTQNVVDKLQAPLITEY